ncbi:MAG: hypothetical protein KF706_00470 [Chitinophagales bacterium]|nr:hypothetical protein [Chitinophagales bacterium]OJV30822.1 MAG: hypothetical protein BGO32_10025 [Bacteroidetes bacterium 37-13]HRN93604.1 hypothetical protein [Chitinophagales bacterium]HRP39156.1 hypothetical protein [Chitinophagales bacterium]
MERILIALTGWIGAILVLYAYFMISTKRLQGNSVHYQTANILGAICLMINTYFNHAYPSAAVNLIWIGIGFYSLLSKQKEVQTNL